MHWQTYRATLRRNGTWKRDLNLELVNPFTRMLASSWARVFEQDLFERFGQAANTAITKLLRDIEDTTTSQALKDRAHAQSTECHNEAREKLDSAIEAIRNVLTRSRRKSLAPSPQACKANWWTAMSRRLRSEGREV